MRQTRILPTAGPPTLVLSCPECDRENSGLLGKLTRASAEEKPRMVRLGRAKAFGCTKHTMIETEKGKSAPLGVALPNRAARRLALR